jgi:hypothetical protein
MKLGEDYVLTVDPKASDQDSWSVILNNDPWENVVLRYCDIQILEKGTKLSFSPELLYVPEGVETDSQEFKDYIAAVLNEVIKDLHQVGGMQYFNKETGEPINV